MAQQEVLRAFQFELDPTPAQVEVLSRHADATWWAFNRALGDEAGRVSAMAARR